MRRMQFELGFCPNAGWRSQFGGAGVPPAVLRCDTNTKTAGETSAPPKPARSGKAGGHRLHRSNRGEMPGLGE